MTLADLKPGKTAIVDEIMGEKYGEGFAKRLYAMGIFPNKSITVLRKAPLGGPVHIRVGMTTEVALRLSEANQVNISFPEV